jgi:hypothetical protein
MKQFDVMPQPLAEYAEPAMLALEMERYKTRRNPEGLFRSAWNYVEYGTNKNNLDSVVNPDYYFEYAQNLIGMTLNKSGVYQDTELGALVLSTYLPLFKKRRFDEPLTPEDCGNVYRSLGQAMAYLQPLKIDEPPQWRMAETAVLALSARTSRPEFLLYPTSPREESSAEAVLNHDSYFIDNGSKIPIQQKLVRTEKEYDDWITILTLQPLIERGVRKTSLRKVYTLADQVNHLLSLIVTETNGERITKQEASFLNTISAAIVSHRYKKRVGSDVKTADEAEMAA